MTLPSFVHPISEENRVLDWQKNVARSTASRSPEAPPNNTQVIVNHITKPTVVVSHSAPRSRDDIEINTRAIIGTLLGASAGAAVAYAMVRGEHDNRQAQGASRVQYPVKRISETAVVVKPPLADIRGHQPQHTRTYKSDRASDHQSISGPRVETVASSTRSRRESMTQLLRSIPSPPSYVQSDSGHTIVKTRNGTKVISGSTHSRNSRRPSSSKTEKRPSLAANVPLPHSRVPTLITGYDTVMPNDSISQVSTNRPSYKERSSHSLHHSDSKTGSSHRRHAVHADGSTARPHRSRADTSRR